MKRLLCCACALLLLSGCMPAAQPEAESGGEAGLETSSQPEAESGGEAGLETSSQFSIDPAVDPPLLADIELLEIPDFLNEEQTLLYRRAFSIWGLFRGNSSFVFENMRESESNPMEWIHGFPYMKTEGKYSRWENFIQLLNSIFVAEYTEELIAPSEYSQHFLKKDGLVYIQDGGKGSGYGYVPPDTFELRNETPEELDFYVIGHYRDYETWTEKIPIEMVLTADGWRFRRFGTTVNDNTDPPVYRDYVHP